MIGYNGQPLFESLSCTEPADKMPEGKGLARADQDMADLRGGERKIDRLVLLKLHIDIAELPANQRIVLLDYKRQRLLRSGLCEFPSHRKIFQGPHHDTFPF